MPGAFAAETDEIKVGVIGCGAIAELYHLPALAKMAGAERRTPTWT